MKKIAIKNIKDTFAANPDVQTFYHNEYGHCFTTAFEGLTPVTRESIAKEKAEDETEEESGSGSTGDKTPEQMTVAELKAALTALNVEFAANVNKATLVELLVNATKEQE